MGRANGRRLVIKLIVIAMKVSMFRIKRMDMAYSTGKVEIFIREIIKKMKEMDKGKCSGLMDPVIKELGNKESSMVRVKWYFQMALSRKVCLKIMYSWVAHLK